MDRKTSITYRIGGVLMLLLLIGVALSFGSDYKKGISPKEIEEAVWFKFAVTGHSVAFSPDGKIIATTGGFGTVLLFNTSDGSLAKVLTGHTDWVSSVAFSPDGKLLASGSGDGTIKIWNVSNGSCIKTLTGHTGWVSSVAFSPDGKLLASGSYDGIALWRNPSNPK